MSAVDERSRARIDEELRAWQQGDCVVDRQWFVHWTDPAPTDSAEAASEDRGLIEVEVRGFMIATQTCDIVRKCATHPFVEVCPLVEVDPQQLHEIQRMRRPRYAYVPGIADDCLVADLGRVMTVDKAVVAQWAPTPGCRTDEEGRRLAAALIRKYARFAFPDDFHSLVSPLLRRMTGKHGKDSAEGRALRSLQQIRVRANPAWNEEEKRIGITFHFIREEDQQLPLDGKGWDQHVDAWLKLVPEQGRFTSVDGYVVTLSDLAAKDYVESDLLDLDHLSVRGDQ